MANKLKPGQNNKKLPDLLYKNKDWLYQKYWVERLNMPAICKECGIHFKTLYYWMDKYGIERRNKHQHHKDTRHLQYKQKDWLIEEYINKKRTTTDIAKECKISPSIIPYWLRANGIEVQSKVGRYLMERSPSWKGGKFKSSGYIYVYCPLHPRVKDATKKYLAEHIIIMEKHIGRFLKAGETVHHINGDRSDNRIENLCLMKDEKEHHTLEQKLNSFAKQLLFGNINISNHDELLRLWNDFQDTK